MPYTIIKTLRKDLIILFQNSETKIQNIVTTLRHASCNTLEVFRVLVRSAFFNGTKIKFYYMYVLLLFI